MRKTPLHGMGSSGAAGQTGHRPLGDRVDTGSAPIWAARHDLLGVIRFYGMRE